MPKTCWLDCQADAYHYHYHTDGRENAYHYQNHTCEPMPITTNTTLVSTTIQTSKAKAYYCRNYTYEHNHSDFKAKAYH